MRKWIIILLILFCRINIGISQNKELDSLVKVRIVCGRTYTPKGFHPPLLILDGKRIKNAKKIDSKDIESISVLKDKSAIEIYGEKAKNGVIIIMSKKK